MSDGSHIFVCPNCGSLEYTADLRSTDTAIFWDQNDTVIARQTCRVYDCACISCQYQWEDYECDSVVPEGDEDGESVDRV